MMSRDGGEAAEPSPERADEHIVAEQLARVRVRLAEQMPPVATGHVAHRGEGTTEALQELAGTLAGLLKADAALVLLHEGTPAQLVVRVRSGSVSPKVFADGLPCATPWARGCWRTTCSRRRTCARSRSCKPC